MLGGDCVGYAYVSSGGHIGPLAVARPDALGTAFKTAMHLTTESGSSQVSAFLPGSSKTALTTAVEARDAGKLEAATDYAASEIANRHGSGEVAAKIQAHVIVAVV